MSQQQFLSTVRSRLAAAVPASDEVISRFILGMLCIRAYSDEFLVYAAA